MTETMPSTYVPAWNSLGTGFRTDRKVKTPEALIEAELDWEVDLVPVEYNDLYTGYNLVVRDDQDTVLGCVGDRYEPIQQREAFSMLDDLLDSGDIQLERAFEAQGGRRVFLVARRPEDVLIAGETYRNYIVCRISHDGSGSVIFKAVPTREFCQNIFNVSVGGGYNAAGSGTYRVRHTANAHLQILAARRALNVTYKHTKDLALLGESMVLDNISDAEFDRFLKDLIEDPKDDERKRAQKSAEMQRAAIRDVYRYSDNLNDIRGTRWGVLNAVVEWGQHVKSYKTDERRFLSIADGNTVDQRALNLLLK